MKTLKDILGTVYEVWSNQSGGTVKREYTEEGIKYVVVEFDNSPGVEYIYYKADN